MRMPAQPSADQTLRAENAELRARLDEASETLRAIRAGEVDALVVEGDAGPRLFTLQGLDAEQNRLRGEMLAQVSDAMIAVDLEQRITFLNAAAERQYGVTASDVLGHALSELHEGRWLRPEDEALSMTALRDRGEWHGETLHRTRDGRELHVESSVALLRGPDGAPTGVVSAIRDITKRKEAETALRRNAALFSEIIEQAPGGVYVVDAQFHLAQVNAESLPFFASVQPLIGRDFDEVMEILWGREIGPQCASIFRHTLATGERYVSPRFSEQRHDIGVEQAFEWETQRITLPDGQHGVVCYFQEVTARERAEALRREGEERLALAVKCSQVVLFQQDLELRYTWLQNAVPGFDDSVAIGKRDADLMERAADAALTEALKREVIRSGVSQRQETQVQIGGMVRHFDLLVEPQRDAAGLVTGVTCAAIDITMLKRAEAARHEMERNYRALGVASSEVLYSMSADWSTMLPLDGRQLVASSDNPLGDWAWMDQNIPRDDHTRIRQAISEAIARKSLFELEHRVRRPDGSTCWTLSRAVPIVDDNDNVTAWFGAASDITARKQAEQALADRTELLNGVLEGTTDMIFVKDLDGRYMMANNACATVLGSAPEHVVGKTNEELCPPDLAAALRQHHEAVMAGGSPIQREETFVVAGKARVFLTLKAPLRNGSGRVIGILGISRDITERKQAEERLRASEARLRRVFESNVVGMIRWDLDRSLILDANAEFLRMTGYVRDDITGGRLNFRDLTPPEWTARNEEGIRAIRATGHAPPYEKEYFHKDGSRLPLIIAGTRFEDSPSEGISFLIDLTEMKQAERALRASADRHSYLVKLADTLRPLSDPIQIQAEAGRVLGEHLGANRVLYFEIQGDDYVVEPNYAAGVMPLQGRYPTRSFGSGMFADFQAGRMACSADVDAEATRPESEREAFAALQIKAHVTVPLVKDGVFVSGLAVHSSSRRTWTSTEIAMIEDTAERTWAAVARARAEQTLADRTALLNGVLEGTTDVIFVKDLDGRMLLANAACAAAARSTPEQLVGKTDEELFPPDVAAAIRQHDEALIAGGSPMQFEETLPMAGEARVFLTVKAPLRDGSGRIIGILGISRDITERKRAEEALRDSAVMLADHDRRKDAFLATLSHELRNPLGVIGSSLHLLQLTGQDRDAVQQGCARMQRQLVVLTRLIDDLMDVSRINQDKLTLQTERLDLAIVAESAREISRTVLDQRGHTVTVVLPSQPVQVDGDATRLVQVVSNLLINAAKYSEPDHPIVLTVGRQGDVATVTVRDRGIGIAPEDLCRVFELFAQIGGAAHLAQGGLGIGLNLVKRVVEMHGGSVYACSDGLGHGSEFLVRLPLASAGAWTERPPERGALSPSPSRRYRLLVADDNEDAVTALALLLGELGHDVRTARDGAQAVAVAAIFQPEVALLDIGMPELDGHEACRRIRALPGGDTMVLIAVSGWGQVEDKQRARSAGFQHHLVKPVDAAALIALLESLAPP